MANTISHGNGQMRAQSLSVQISSRERCTAGCLFCISRTTPGAGETSQGEIKLCHVNRFRVGLNFARQLGASHTVFTSKADPTQENPRYLCEMVGIAREYLPLADLHTNGFNIHPGMPAYNLLPDLVNAGLTMITFSIASFDPAVNQKLMIIKKSAADLIEQAANLELMVRCSLVINKAGVKDFDGIIEYAIEAGKRGAHAVVVREIWVPEVYGDFNRNVYEWNLANRIDIGPLQDEFISAAEARKHGIQRLKNLPWGTPVFGIAGCFPDKSHGVNVTFARCEEATEGAVMKSIVHKPNGHSYRNWDHNGDILY